MATETSAATPAIEYQAIELNLPIEGMTCASCSNRVERFLRKTEGVVEANVNLATEHAQIRFDPQVVGRDELARAVEAAGYNIRAEEAQPADAALEAASEADAERRRGETRELFREAAAAILIGAAMMAATFWAGGLLSLAQLNLVLIVPASVVQFGLGRRFYVTAIRAARHGSANMSTLVVLGTSAAWLYSTLVTFVPSFVTEAGVEPMTYYDSAAVIIGLVLAGRWLEARAKAETAGAVRRLAGLQPRTARVVRDGREIDTPIEQLQPGDLVRVRPGRESARRRAHHRGQLSARRGDADGRGDARGQGRWRRGHRRLGQHHRHVHLPRHARRA